MNLFNGNKKEINDIKEGMTLLKAEVQSLKEKFSALLAAPKSNEITQQQILREYLFGEELNG